MSDAAEWGHFDPTEIDSKEMVEVPKKTLSRLISEARTIETHPDREIDDEVCGLIHAVSRSIHQSRGCTRVERNESPLEAIESNGREYVPIEELLEAYDDGDQE